MRGILDAIYWKLHTAFLMNRRDEARRFLSMLDDELSQGKGSLVGEIGPVHMLRYRGIREKMERNEFGRLHGDGVDADALDFSWPDRTRSGPEREFCRELSRNVHRLFGAMDFDLWSHWVTEADMRPYGRCDFLVTEGRRAAVVEVKMGSAPTSVVAQVDKYRVAMELDMCMGALDEVLAYVLAESFPPYVAAELSRLDVRMIEHRGTPESLRKTTDKRSVLR